MAKRNIKDGVTATTEIPNLNASRVGGYGLTDLLSFSTDIHINANVYNKFGYAYSERDSFFKTIGPAMVFGVPNYMAVIQSDFWDCNLYYTTYRNGSPSWKQFAFQDWVQAQFVSRTSAASLVFIDDLKEILSPEQIAKLSAKVQQRIETQKETQNSNAMNIKDLQMGGGISES